MVKAGRSLLEPGAASPLWSVLRGHRTMSKTDDDLKTFMRDVLALEGLEPNRVRRMTLFYVTEYDRTFRGVQRCRKLCCQRVTEEITRCEGTPTADHLRTVLNVINVPVF